MDKKTTQTSRVVRTGKKTTGRRPKKPANVATKSAKAIFFTVSKIILTTILVITITCCIVGTALTIYVMEYINSDPIIDLETVKMNFTSSIYAQDENGANVEIQSLSRGENRIWVDIDQIPKHVQDAFVYSEDERFANHKGVDFKRSFFALANEVLKKFGIETGLGKFGASTITQQLIKNINGDYEDRGIDKKIQEIIGAMNLDRKYSKDQILEMYLNYVGLHYASGVQAGAKYFFGKDVSELTYAEAAALASTTKSPSTLNPKDYPTENKERRNIFALPKMLEFGTITQAEYDAALKEELVVVGKTTGTNEDGTPIKKKAQSWYVDAAIEAVIDDLCKKFNYSREYAQTMLFTSGYQVYIPMEVKTQEILEKYFENEETFALKGIKPENIPKASMIIMDYDGNVRAVAGDKGEKVGDRIWNNATMAVRPSGSTIKPLSVYTPAFENNFITWSSIMMDESVKNIIDEETGLERPYPKNYDGAPTNKPFTIIDAIKVSKNTIAVKLCEHLSPQVSYDFLTNELGISTLNPADNLNEASLALGDAGYKLSELTAAFQIYGNGGYYTKPKFYTKVTDNEGKVILDTTTNSKTQVMSPQTAYIMNKALWCVVNEPQGSGQRAKLENFETVGKTGTSNNRKDLVFMGCTPYYVAGIRYGYDDNEKTIPNSAGSAQIPVWQKIMTEIHAGKNPAKFELSDDGVVVMEYCTTSGKLAHSGCPAKKSGYYKTVDIPDECSDHVQP